MFLVLCSMSLCLLDHSFDLFFSEAARRGDLDRLLFTGSHIFCRNMYNSVRVDIKGHLNLRHSPGRRWNPYEIELAQEFVVRCHLSLSLKDSNRDCGLVVLCGRKNLTLSCRDRCIALNQLCGNAPQGLYPKRQGSHIKEEDILDFPREYCCLNRRTHSHHFVRVDPFVRILTKELLHSFLNRRHPSHAPHQDDFMDIARG